MASDAREQRPLAVVLVSGGLDSAVCLAEALRSHDVAALHINYGQRTEARELRAFTDLTDHYGIDRRLVADISYLKEIGGSALVDPDLPVAIIYPAPIGTTTETWGGVKALFR